MQQAMYAPIALQPWRPMIFSLIYPLFKSLISILIGWIFILLLSLGHLVSYSEVQKGLVDVVEVGTVGLASNSLSSNPNV